MHHFKYLPYAATNVNLQLVSNYPCRTEHLCYNVVVGGLFPD